MGSLIRGASLLIVLVVLSVTDFQAADCIRAAGEILSRRSLAHAGSESMYHMASKLSAGRETWAAHKVHDKVLRTSLIHRDHPDSPLSRTSNTMSQSERMAAAVKRSSARRDYISRRRRAAEDFESQVTQDIGEYTMALSVGTPPQRFIAVMDTGSDLVWLNCLPCIQCINQPHGPPFNPGSSSSYSHALCADNACQDFPNGQSTCAGTSSCQYYYAYGDGSSTTGDLAYETFTVLNLDGTATAIEHVTFGCGHNQSGQDFNGADGLVGLGQGSFSLPSQIQNIYADIFSYCLVGSASSTASTFLFGSPEGVVQGLVYTPIIPNILIPTFYYVGMTGITVGGTPLTLPFGTFDISLDGSGGVIFDSGTTLTYLNTDAFNAVVQAVQSLVTYPQVDASFFQMGLCYDLTGVTNPSFPAMAFQFQGANGGATVDFELAPENFLIEFQAPIVCLSILPTDQVTSIIGNIAQQDHHMVFDRVSNRIGWVSTTCN